MISDLTVKTIKWGVRPSDEIISEIEQWLAGGAVVFVILDKNYPTSMNSEGFEEEMKKLSAKIGIPHEIEFSDVFRAVFKIKDEEMKVPPSKTPTIDTLSDSNEEFAFGFYSHLIKESSEKNIVVSPLSAAIALSIVYNGAAGDTEKAIGDVLGITGMKSEDINRTYGSFLSDIKNADPKVNISIANSLWSGTDRKFREDFVKTISANYGADVLNIDFNSSDAAGQINRWVNQKTEGKISDIVDESIKDSILLIINAVYFKGIWREVFDEKLTKDDTFYLMNGGEKKVRIMFQEGGYKYLENSEFQAISLPYGHGRVSMYLFLPDKKIGIKKFHQILNRKNFQEWASLFKKREGRIGLPKFKQEYGIDLKGIMSSMGMKAAFDREHANFDGMFQDSKNIFIGMIKHKTFIEVNEKGTEAGAAAAVEIMKEELPPEEPFTMIINRPFFFAVRDNESGMLIFMGAIFEPDGKGERKMEQKIIEKLISSELRKGEDEYIELSKAYSNGSITEEAYKKRMQKPPPGYKVWFGDEVSYSLGKLEVNSIGKPEKDVYEITATCDTLRESSHHYYDPEVYGDYENYLKKRTSKAKIKMKVTEAQKVIEFDFQWL